MMNYNLQTVQNPGENQNVEVSEFSKFIKNRTTILAKANHVVIDFFVVYARFEYALTMAGYLKKGSINRADADVEEYYKHIESLLDKKSIYSQYLEEKKPQQRKRNLKWGSNIRLATSLDCVCQIRNNLFHGGKQPDLNHLYPERDLKLIQSALNLIEECISKGHNSDHKKCKKVSEFFLSMCHSSRSRLSPGC